MSPQPDRIEPALEAVEALCLRVDYTDDSLASPDHILVSLDGNFIKAAAASVAACMLMKTAIQSPSVRHLAGASIQYVRGFPVGAGSALSVEGHASAEFPNGMKVLPLCSSTPGDESSQPEPCQPWSDGDEDGEPTDDADACPPGQSLRDWGSFGAFSVPRFRVSSTWFEIDSENCTITSWEENSDAELSSGFRLRAVPGLIERISAEIGKLSADWASALAQVAQAEVQTPPATPNADDPVAETLVTGFQIMARFRPQAWIRDYAVDIDGARDVDVTDTALKLFLSDSAYFANFKDSSDYADLLVDAEALGHQGPFEVHAVKGICRAFGVESLSEIDRAMLEAAARRRQLGIPTDAAGEDGPTPAERAIAELRLDLTAIRAANAEALEQLQARVDALRPGIEVALADEFFNATDGIRGVYSAMAANDCPDDASEQESAISEVESWVAENLTDEVEAILLHKGAVEGLTFVDGIVEGLRAHHGQAQVPERPAGSGSETPRQRGG